MEARCSGIERNSEDGGSKALAPDEISHLALDIGGTLIKLVYFSRNDSWSVDDKGQSLQGDSPLRVSCSNLDYPILYGRIHLQSCWHHEAPVSDKNVIKATGGGAYKFADLFKENLGLNLDKEDEMDCLVSGANFLLKAVHHEAFTYMDGQKEFVQIDHNDLYPYLLVNIGSGVSMLKVDGDGKFERVSGTNVGGGTFWGLGRLLTKCKSFDELLELSHQGNNRVIDMLVGDIYGGMDYSKFGLASTTIASSFGKAISENKELEDYRPEDVSRSLLRMISNNIGQVRYFWRIFIRGHAYTMDTISVAVNFGNHEEFRVLIYFLVFSFKISGALGAFMSYEKNNYDGLMVHQLVEQVSTSASYSGDKIHSSLAGDLNDSESIGCSVYTT
ncbi:hypothetical protein AAG906_035200 [Vitis piasezkii]